jgi:excinuclease ABC subunit C
MMMDNDYLDYLKSLIEVLPDKPGVYQFLDNKNEVIYIGKARNLKKRVASYFTRTKYENNKLRILVKKIADIKHIIVADESDALLLENNLIKKYKPRYNVQLKDDKSFPWICIKNEPFPRVFKTRNLIRDRSIYYGPYTSVNMVRTLLELIRQLFPLRTCKYNLTEENIKNQKFKVCLEYHMGNCKAPCVAKQTKEEYEESIKFVQQILKGNIFQVIEHLQGLMNEYAKKYKFEQAQIIKEKINILEKYRSKSMIVNPKIDDIEVYSLAEEDETAFVNFLRIINGSIVQAQTFEIRKKLDESVKDLLSIAIFEIRQRFGISAKEIIVPVEIDLPIAQIKYTIPRRGEKKQLLNLSERNAKLHMLEKRKRQELVKPDLKVDRILDTAMKDLRLKEKPVHIECFDNSNIMGKNPAAACVVFKNARPSKKDYRHFTIKTVTGPNDFASMEEVIYRRYKRILDENETLPQLLIIDGGKGQLNAATKSLDKLNLRGKTAVIGVAKRLEEIYFPGDKIPLYINKNSETLRLIQQIRNEAHRFGIKLHRGKRTKAMMHSELDNIRGIGEKTRNELLKKLGSVDEIMNTKPEVIINLIGRKKAELLIVALKKNKHQLD